MNINVIQQPSTYDIEVMGEWDCQHLDTDYEDKEFNVDTFWADAQMYVPDDSVIEQVLTCQRTSCKKWLDKDGTWREA